MKIGTKIKDCGIIGTLIETLDGFGLFRFENGTQYCFRISRIKDSEIIYKP